MSYYLDCLRKYADFSGRARRKEYWTFILINSVIYLILKSIFTFSDSQNVATTLKIIYITISLTFLLPCIAVTVRRLHDVGKSGAWYFISFIPIIGGIWLLLLMLNDSDYEENEYGPCPKIVDADY